MRLFLCLSSDICEELHWKCDSGRLGVAEIHQSISGVSLFCLNTNVPGGYTRDLSPSGKTFACLRLREVSLHAAQDKRTDSQVPTRDSERGFP